MATKAHSKVRVREGPALKPLLQALRASGKGGAYVRVGFLGEGESRQGGEGLSNASLAAVHEYGSPESNIPERPFMGPSFDAHVPSYEKILTKQAEAYLASGTGLEEGMGLLGLKMVTDVRNYVVGGAPLPPPNSPEVAERKGKGGGTVRTLVDTGQMVRAVAHAVSTGKRPEGG